MVMSINISNLGVITDRAISAFPISIGTSLALESLFNPRLEPYDPSRKIPQIVDVNKYSTIYINLATLFRNLASAMDKSNFLSATANNLSDIILSEIDVINSLFQIEGGGVCTPIYYSIEYNDLLTLNKKGIVKLRKPQTDGQKHHQLMNDKTLKILIDTLDLKTHKDTIKAISKTNSLILTHVPYDLLSVNQFKSLDLLESNTGKLKTKFQWNSKYYPIADNDLSHLPFLRELLLLLGDRVSQQPPPIKLRRLIYDISIKRKWTPVTTVDKIKYDFKLDIKEPYVLKHIESL